MQKKKKDEKKDEITDRIVQYLALQNITKYKFNKDIGFSSAFLGRSRGIRTDKLIKILAYLPELNPEWLLTGEGAMKRDQENASTLAVAPKADEGSSNNKYLELLEKYVQLLKAYTALLQQNVVSNQDGKKLRAAK
jgi:hypothetical protein